MLYARTNLKTNKGDIMRGITKIINSEEITEVIYESDPYTEIKNPETGDYYKFNGNPIKQFLYSLGGGATVTIWDAKNRFNDNTVNKNTVFIDKRKQNAWGDKREIALFHELGHVLFPKNSEQEKVIEFDNRARSETGDSTREVDDAHRNTSDP